jgi:ADP-ribosyl-[dinitrogen reductase] hydrolase
MNSPSTISKRDRILGGLWGSLVGDALGVPVEFRDRATLQANPVKGMRGDGTHHQPPGTWSDDGALLLCSADSLVHHEFDVQDMGGRFVRWIRDGEWTVTGEVFDVGNTTMDALTRIANGTWAELAGGCQEHHNGNGSLMRILPVALRFAREPVASFASNLEQASAITHGHPRSTRACAFYGLVARELLSGQEPKEALRIARAEFARYYESAHGLHRFRHLLEDDLAVTPEDQIASSGYVLHTLHASLWTLLTTSSFEACVLKAVNLGGDTDTTGCVAGGLAGVHYGLNAIPPEWLNTLPRHEEVGALFNRFAELASA